jgi:hypothetical protein
VQDEDPDSYVESAVGGMADEDDSLEQEVAMSSPMKGNELRAAKKVMLVYLLIDILTRSF